MSSASTSPTERPAGDNRTDNSHAAPTASAQLADIVSLRWQLAESEIRSDVSSAKRFALVGGSGLLAALVSLPIVVMVAAGQVETRLGWQFPWATLATGLILLVAGLGTAWSGWRRFRAEFLGLQESISELREDAVWLRELVEGE